MTFQDWKKKLLMASLKGTDINSYFFTHYHDAYLFIRDVVSLKENGPVCVKLDHYISGKVSYSIFLKYPDGRYDHFFYYILFFYNNPLSYALYRIYLENVIVFGETVFNTIERFFKGNENLAKKLKKIDIHRIPKERVLHEIRRALVFRTYTHSRFYDCLRCLADRESSSQ